MKNIFILLAGILYANISCGQLANYKSSRHSLLIPKLDFFNAKNNNLSIDVAPTTDDLVYIDFVGSGDIQKSISEGNDINANTGLGLVFERYSGDDGIIQGFELEGVINIATTADTIVGEMTDGKLNNQRNFGTYVLNPVSAKQSMNLNANLYFGYPDNALGVITRYAVSGVNCRITASNNVWKYNDTSSSLGAMYFRAGLFHEFLPDNYRLTDEKRSKYSIFLGVNYSMRAIYGDLTADKYNSFRQSILGDTKNIFHGFELNFGFRLNNLRAEFQMPMLQSKNGSIDGLTNTQFLFSIKFIGGFALKINDIGK